MFVVFVMRRGGGGHKMPVKVKISVVSVNALFCTGDNILHGSKIQNLCKFGLFSCIGRQCWEEEFRAKQEFPQQPCCLPRP